jgi:hypothetical protein
MSPRELRDKVLALDTFYCPISIILLFIRQSKFLLKAHFRTTLLHGWFRLWCLTPLLTIYSVLYRRSILLAVETGETTDLSQVADKFYHIMLYRVHLAMNGIRTHNYSGNRHWLHRYLEIQLPYDHDGPLCYTAYDDGSLIWKKCRNFTQVFDWYMIERWCHSTLTIFSCRCSSVGLCSYK